MSPTHLVLTELASRPGKTLSCFDAKFDGWLSAPFRYGSTWTIDIRSLDFHILDTNSYQPQSTIY